MGEVLRRGSTPFETAALLRAGALAAAFVLLPVGGASVGALGRREASMEAGMHVVSLNQLGYRPDDAKVAFVGGYRGVFEVVDGAGRSIFRGNAEHRGVDALSGDDLSIIDFSPLADEGTYRVRLAGSAGESASFAIAADPYRDLARALLRELHFQRCGTALLPRFAGSWAHGACHLAPALLYDSAGESIDARGGWHDAGDYGRYVVPGAITVSMLLLAYELFPQVRWDDLGIPESGNGIPDLLDEAKWELDWMLAMQDENTGGVYHKVTSASFPGFIMPEEDGLKEIVSPVSPTATASFAAVTAQASRVYRGIDRGYAARLLSAAKRAFVWLEANPHAKEFVNPPGIVTGEYGDSSSADERFWASVELARTTGKEDYLGGPPPGLAEGETAALELGWQETGGFAALAVLSHGGWSSGGAGSALQLRLREGYRKFIAGCMERASSGYGVAVGREDFVWGSNMLVLNRGVHLIMASRFLAESSGESTAYRTAAEAHLHYLLGANPLSFSYVSGFGTRRLEHPHNRPSIADGVVEPVPGLVAGGPNSGRQDPDAAAAFAEGTPPMRAYVDLAGSYSTNENAIYWNAPAFFVAAAFVR